MRIGYDLRRINNPGIGRYMRRIVEGVLQQAPQNEYVLIMAPGTEELIAGRCAPNVKTIVTTLPYYSIREQFELRSIARREKLDLFHSPHFLMPLLPACPTVITIHDVIYIACKEDLESRVGRIYYKWMMKAAAHQSQRIITDSEYSKKDIVRLLGVPPEKVDVVLLGVENAFQPVREPQRLDAVAKKYGATKPFVLYTGIYKLRKNHAALLRAFANVRHSGFDLQLLIGGPLKEGKATLQQLASELDVAADVLLPGFIDETDLPALYSAALVYACPSNYEGFGFTILEAMGCGTPVVCNPSTSLPEVAGDAVLWANANSPQEFGQALARVCRDKSYRNDLVLRGFENIRRFQWQQAVSQTLVTYRRVLEEPGLEIPQDNIASLQ
jgi:glycosyltransferase involved in cell wall biosynthesis